MDTLTNPTTGPGTGPRAVPMQRNWIWQVTGLALFLGLLLGASLRAQKNFKDQNIYTSRYGVPPTVYREQLSRNKELSAEILALQEDKTRLTNLISQSGAGTKKLQTLNADLQETRAFAGLTEMEGPGVVVTLKDADKEKVKTLTKALGAGYDPREYIIHDMDIFQIVNELRAAGAEAIAINDQRLTATSPIRCEGPTVRVNYTQVGVPLQIKAIGDPTALASGLQMTGGVMDPSTNTLALLGMVSLARESKIIIPPFAGPTAFHRAKPIQ